MSVKKDYRKYGYRYMVLNLLSMLPFIPVFVIFVYRGKFDNIGISLTVVFVVGAVFGLAWQHRRHSRIRCPQCKDILFAEKNLARGAPNNFRCTRCDVEWVTGLLAGHGD